jgi:ArsR family metal-binding transcriptional regulator
MNTLELKNILKFKIDLINDKKFLEALTILIESKTDQIITLSDEQKNSLEASKNEYLLGNFENNNILNEEIEKWLKE